MFWAYASNAARFEQSYKFASRTTSDYAVPSCTSHKPQPYDVSVFGPLKAAHREQVERLFRGGADTVGKEHFASLYDVARKRALTPKNIKSGWAKAGLYPFDPTRILQGIRKPLVQLTVPTS